MNNADCITFCYMVFASEPSSGDGLRQSGKQAKRTDVWDRLLPCEKRAGELYFPSHWNPIYNTSPGYSARRRHIKLKERSNKSRRFAKSHPHHSRKIGFHLNDLTLTTKRLRRLFTSLPLFQVKLIKEFKKVFVIFIFPHYIFREEEGNNGK